MLPYVEEIRALEVRISLRLSGVDGIRVDGGPNFGFGDVTFITFQDAADRSEFSQHIRDHHVFDLELGRGVNAIDCLGTGARFGLNHDMTRLIEFGCSAIDCGAHFNSPVLTLSVITTIWPSYASAVPNSRARFSRRQVL